jgi:hypothetical protein
MAKLFEGERNAFCADFGAADLPRRRQFFVGKRIGERANLHYYASYHQGVAGARGMRRKAPSPAPDPRQKKIDNILAFFEKQITI